MGDVVAFVNLRRFAPCDVQGSKCEVLGAGPPDHPHHPVALGQEEVGQVGAVLAGDAGDQGGGERHSPDLESRNT